MPNDIKDKKNINNNYKKRIQNSNDNREKKLGNEQERKNYHNRYNDKFLNKIATKNNNFRNKSFNDKKFEYKNNNLSNTNNSFLGKNDNKERNNNYSINKENDKNNNLSNNKENDKNNLMDRLLSQKGKSGFKNRVNKFLNGNNNDDSNSDENDFNPAGIAIKGTINLLKQILIMIFGPFLLLLFGVFIAVVIGICISSGNSDNTFGIITAVYGSTTMDESDPMYSFTNLLTVVNNDYNNSGRRLDIALLTCAFTIISNESNDYDFSKYNLQQVNDMAASMFSGNFYDEETFKSNLKSNIFPAYFSNKSGSYYDSLISDIFELYDNYNDEYGGSITNNIGGVGAAVFLKIAEGELSDSNTSKFGGKKYQDYMRIGDSAWCASFVSWCAKQAGISNTIVPSSAAVTVYYSFYTKAGLFKKIDSGYIPRAGDLIIWENKQDTNAKDWSHIGIVQKYDEVTGQVYTIEGNSDDKVSNNVYNSIQITGCTGFATPNYPSSSDTGLLNGTLVEIPQDFSQVYTITEYDKFYERWSGGTVQRQLANVWGEQGKKFDDGIATISNRYLIAVVNTLGSPGDMLDVYLSDGTVLPCIVADAKSLNDSNITTYGHITGNSVSVIEFEVKSEYYKKYGNPGTNGWKTSWKQNVVKVINGGKFL